MFLGAYQTLLLQTGPQGEEEGLAEDKALKDVLLCRVEAQQQGSCSRTMKGGCRASTQLSGGMKKAPQQCAPCEDSPA